MQRARYAQPLVIRPLSRAKSVRRRPAIRKGYSRPEAVGLENSARLSVLNKPELV